MPTTAIKASRAKPAEVLSLCNEILGQRAPLHAYFRDLFAWAVLFPVPKCGTFDVAANMFGRLSRACPEAVSLPREVAIELAVLFAHGKGMELYLEDAVVDGLHGA
eukprot:TRINITY_DN7735_c1_g1_i1.p3 TRINITY_DN7735_c1_g1~~TRINITY_DN7735_c1_g1_i1.p3  ORF type:complete len:106 (-),score=8.48 TRINITY_DN7735_c1_g1_i1:42-359(-)